MIYEQSIIEEIRSLNDIVSIVSTYVDIKNKGNNFFGLCPFHNEKTPSFSVSVDKQIYYCFGCGATGNVYSFLMQIENYTFPEALKYLAEKVNYELPSPSNSEDYKKHLDFKNRILEVNKVTARLYYNNLISDISVQNYLQEREISKRAIVKFGLGYSIKNRVTLYKYLKEKGYTEEFLLKSGLIFRSEKGTYHDRFYNRLMFPIFDVMGNVVAFGARSLDDTMPKYLNSPDTVVFSKKCHLYGINFARKSNLKTLILVEGYMDVIALVQKGFNNTVATLGTALNLEHAKVIKKYVETVILLFDSDEAGIKATLRAIPILLTVGLKVKVCQLANAKDPDEFIKKYGVNKFKESLKNSEIYLNFQINQLKKNVDFNNTEEVIAFTKEVSILISKIENEIEKDLYIKKVSDFTKVSIEAIKKELIKLNKSPINNTNLIKKQNLEYINKVKNSNGITEAKKTMIYLIATNKVVYKSVKDVITAEDMQNDIYIKLLDIVYSFYKKEKEIYIAEILNFFETIEEQREVFNIFNSKIEYADYKDLEKIINEIIKSIKMNKIENEIVNNKNDINKVNKLINSRKNIQNMYITLLYGKNT